MEKFFLTIMDSWSSDTPNEVINDLLIWAKSKGFQTHLWFEESTTQGFVANNETLVKELSDFFEEKMK